MPPSFNEPPSLDLPSLSGEPPAFDQASMPPGLDAPGGLELPSVSGAASYSAGSRASQLGLPAVPSKVRGGFVQDLPTL